MILIFAVFVAFMLLCGERKYFGANWNKGLSVQLRFCQRGVNAGETCSLEETVENAKRMSLPSLQVKFQTSASLLFDRDRNAAVTDNYYRNDLFAAGGRRRITRKLEFVPIQRGYYRIDTIDVLARDFFYTMTCSQRQENDTCLYVYPYKRDVSRFEILYRRMQGELLAVRCMEEDPFAFRGMREYRPTDSMRRINWKSTAKTGKMLVNIYDSSFSQEICIVLNGTCRQEGKKRELQEMAVSIASSVAQDLLQKGIPVSLRSNITDKLHGEEVCCEAGMGGSQQMTMDRKLALADLKNVTIPFEETVRQCGGGKSFYLIITAEDTTALRDEIEKKREAGDQIYGIIVCSEEEKKPQDDHFIYWSI